MSQIHYCFIAKDPGMVVFETIVAKDLSSQPSAQRAAFRREISDRLHAIEQQVNNTDASDLEQGFIMRNTGALDSNAKVVTCNNFTKGFLNGDVKLTVLSNTVYIGCVSDAGFSDDKAGRFSATRTGKPQNYLMKSISEYFGNGHRSSATRPSSLSAVSRVLSIAGITLSRMYSASLSPSAAGWEALAFSNTRSRLTNSSADDFSSLASEVIPASLHSAR